METDMEYLDRRDRPVNIDDWVQLTGDKWTPALDHACSSNVRGWNQVVQVVSISRRAASGSLLMHSNRYELDSGQLMAVGVHVVRRGDLSKQWIGRQTTGVTLVPGVPSLQRLCVGQLRSYRVNVSQASSMIRTLVKTYGESCYT